MQITSTSSVFYGFSLVIILIAFFSGCSGFPSFVNAPDKQQDNGELTATISGGEGVYAPGERVKLKAKVKNSGTEKISYAWYIGTRQVGGNSPVLELEGAPYLQARVRLVVQAGAKSSETSLVVRWDGGDEVSGGGTQLPGSVVITNVYPEKYLVEGETTRFTIHISCSLPRDISASVRVVFNDGKSVSDYRIHHTEQITGGVQTYIFQVDARPCNWADGDFVLLVMVSADGYKNGLSDSKVLKLSGS